MYLWTLEIFCDSIIIETRKGKIKMKTKRRKRKGFFECLSGISRQAEIFLLVGLPVILIEMLYILCGFLRDYKMSEIYAVTVYDELFSYALMSLTLLIGGALFVDYVIRSSGT